MVMVKMIEYINVRLGLGSVPYRIRKTDIPMLKKILERLELE